MQNRNMLYWVPLDAQSNATETITVYILPDFGDRNISLFIPFSNNFSSSISSSSFLISSFGLDIFVTLKRSCSLKNQILRTSLTFKFRDRESIQLENQFQIRIQ